MVINIMDNLNMINKSIGMFHNFGPEKKKIIIFIMKSYVRAGIRTQDLSLNVLTLYYWATEPDVKSLSK